MNNIESSLNEYDNYIITMNNIESSLNDDEKKK